MSYFHFPFRVVMMLTSYNEEVPVTLLISVSKKNLKKAVQRNRAKRIIRECFRINQHIAVEALRREGISLIVGLIYTPKELPAFNQTNTRMIGLLSHLTEKAHPMTYKNDPHSSAPGKISEPHTENNEKSL